MKKGIVTQTLFYAFVAIMSVVILMLSIIFGTSKYSEAKEKVEEKSRETFESLAKVIKILGWPASPETTLNDCRKEGGIYNYFFNVKGLTLKYEGFQKSDEIEFVPVLQYRGIGALPKGEAKVRMKAGQEITLPAANPEAGLDYEFASFIPPTIFVNKIFNEKEVNLVPGQAVIIRNFRVEVVALRQLRAGFALEPCKVFVTARCEDERLQATLTESSNNQTLNLCGAGIEIRLAGFDHYNDCELRTPKLVITADKETKAMAFPESAELMFCEASGKLPCGAGDRNFLDSFVLNITPENYHTGNCLPFSGGSSSAG